MPIETCKCRHCGTIFQHERTRRAKTFCSRKCYQQHYNQNRRNPEGERLRQAKLRKEKPALSMLYRVRHAAKKQGLACSLTEAWIEQRLNTAVCEVTGLPLVTKDYKPGDQGNRDFFAPSLDRINNNAGYTPSNCRLVCWGYNLVKSNYTDREVLAFSTAVVLQAVPEVLQAKLLQALPPLLRACLPSGNPFVEANGNPIQKNNSTKEAA